MLHCPNFVCRLSSLAVITVALVIATPAFPDELPDGASDLRQMMVHIRDSYARLYERRQYRERWEAAQESMQSTCHPGVGGGERDSVLRRWKGCPTGPRD